MRLIGAGLSVHIQYMDIYVQCHVCVYMYYNKRLLYLHEDRMFQSEVFISSTICMYCILLNKELQKELEKNSATSLYYIICLHGSRLARVCVTCIHVHISHPSPLPGLSDLEGVVEWAHGGCEEAQDKGRRVPHRHAGELPPRVHETQVQCIYMFIVHVHAQSIYMHIHVYVHVYMSQNMGCNLVS